MVAETCYGWALGQHERVQRNLILLSALQCESARPQEPPTFRLGAEVNYCDWRVRDAGVLTGLT